MGPLSQHRVLELGQMGAGPFCGRLLGDFGAEVIKVEQPEGDAVRSFGYRDNGKSLSAVSVMRNKKLVAIDLRHPDGRELVKDLAKHCDIVLENFKPGTLERWGVGYSELAQANPGLIMTRVSGFGQTGPYSRRPGFGVVGEAVSGLRHMTGDADRPPSRVGVPLTDFLAGVYAAFGTLVAVVHRAATGKGQCVDTALYEAAFSFMHQLVPAYDKLAVIPSRTGSRLKGMAPNSLYRGKDGAYVCISAGSQSIFKRLTNVMCRDDLLKDSRFATAEARASHEDDIDAIVQHWVGQFTGAEVETKLVEADVVASRVFDMKNIFEDEHYRAREMLVKVCDAQLGQVTLTGIVPKLSESPGHVSWGGGRIGEHTKEVLEGLLNISANRLCALEERRIVHCA